MRHFETNFLCIVTTVLVGLAKGSEEYGPQVPMPVLDEDPDGDDLGSGTDPDPELYEDGSWGITGGLRSLSPWIAHATIETEYRRWSMPLFACRQVLAEELRSVGPEAAKVASRAVTAGRDFLDLVARDLYSSLPPPRNVGLDDPEIAAIQATLDNGERFPASELIEDRWQRIKWGAEPDDAVLLVEEAFATLPFTLWKTVARELDNSSTQLNPAERSTLSEFATCLFSELAVVELDQSEDEGDSAS